MTTLAPLESEFASTEEAEAYDRWLRGKLAVALADTAPKIPHDQAMAQARDVIETRRRAAARLGA